MFYKDTWQQFNMRRCRIYRYFEVETQELKSCSRKFKSERWIRTKKALLSAWFTRRVRKKFVSSQGQEKSRFGRSWKIDEGCVGVGIFTFRTGKQFQPILRKIRLIIITGWCGIKGAIKSILTFARCIRIGDLLNSNASSLVSKLQGVF